MSLAYIFLTPLNEEAFQILDLPANVGLVGWDSSGMNRQLKLDVDGRKTDPAIVATIGRALDHNIKLPPSRAYARYQCCFFHNRASGELLLEDHSSSRNTFIKYSEDGLEKFQFSDSLRRRVIRSSPSTRLILHKAVFSLSVKLDTLIEGFKQILFAKPVPNDLELSILPLTLPPTIKHTRTLTPIDHVPNQGMRHFRTHELGRGSWGKVSMTINVVTGDRMAVKMIDIQQLKLDEKVIKESVKAQIEYMKNLDHPNIVKITHSEGWGLGQNLEVFMDVYEGDLRKCMAPNDVDEYGPALLRTMLDVLDFLAQKGVTHGDIKPSNILVDKQNNFYLTDFGYVGTGIGSQDEYTTTDFYTAPEVYQQQPSPKSDIWSLGVVMLEVMGKRPNFPPPLIMMDQRKVYRESVVTVGKETYFLPYMLSADPWLRDDARACLDRFFPPGHCGWPVGDKASPDIDMMAMSAVKQTRQKPSWVAKRTSSKKKRQKPVR